MQFQVVSDTPGSAFIPDYYTAPELLESRQSYTQTVDWWILGVLLYEMMVSAPSLMKLSGLSRVILDWLAALLRREYGCYASVYLVRHRPFPIRHVTRCEDYHDRLAAAEP